MDCWLIPVLLLHRGRYLTVTPDGRIIAARKNPGSWECFQLLDVQASLAVFPSGKKEGQADIGIRLRTGNQVCNVMNII